MGTVVSFDVPLSARHDGSLEAAIGWLHWVDRVFSPVPAGQRRVAAGRGRGHRRRVRARGRRGPRGVRRACAPAPAGYFTAFPGGRLDPSGYVKGWAIERAARCCPGRARPATWSTPAVTSSAPAPALRGEPWRVGIADPFRRGGLALVVGRPRLRRRHLRHRRTRRPHPRPAHRPPRHRPGQPDGRRPVPDARRRLRHGRLRDGPGPRPRLDRIPGGLRGLRDHADGGTWQTPGFARHICPA